MATQAQIESALSITGTYNLITGAAVITDATNWTGIGISTPDTMKILLWIQDPAGQTFYQNAGYLTADYTSPDMTLATTTYSFTMPTDITGAYLQGQYTVNMKVEVVEDSETTNAFKALYQNVNGGCSSIVPSVAPNVTYNTAIVSVTDNTRYGTYTDLEVTLTLYPPPQSGQSSDTLVATGSPATLVYDPGVGLYPYTGVWTWTLSSEVTYLNSSGAATTCLVTADGTFNVVQSQLCVVYCLLKKARLEVIQSAANRQTFTEIQQQNLLKAEGEYMLAWAASMCGKPQSEIDVYIQSIYFLINKSPDCDCGCGDGTSQPLVPTSIINGTDGTDGLSFRQGTGAPSGGLGEVGDSYVDSATYNLYKKTGATTWSATGNIQGATGSAGDDGYSILENLAAGTATTVAGSYETLGSKSITAATLGTDKDEAEFEAVFTTPSWTSATQVVRLLFNGSTIIDAGIAPGFQFSNYGKIVLSGRIIRLSNTTAKYQLQWGAYNAGSPYDLLSTQSQPITALASLNWTTTAYTLAAQGYSAVIGDIVLESFKVTYGHKV